MIDDDLDLQSDVFREAELTQARALLRRLIGRKIVDVRVEDTRIALDIDDGTTCYFYGYMGEDAFEA